MALVLDGNGSMTVGNGDITGINTGALPSTFIGAGAVLQVVSAVYNATQSTTSSSPSATGLTASITPTSASSKILILISTQATNTSGGGADGALAIYRNNTTNLGSYGYYQNAYSSGYSWVGMPLSYLDSPSTTSSTTYTMYFSAGTGTFYVGVVRQTMTLMEIAG